MARRRAALLTDLMWRAEAAGFDVLTAIIRRAPLDAVSAAGGWLLRLLGPLTRAHKTARANLLLAFPDMDGAERRALLSAQWDNFGRYVAEFPALDRLTPKGGRVEVVGAERLAEEWWRRPFEGADPARLRDYYRVEDEAGARFWLFRDGLYKPGVHPRWWLHGLFG